MASASTFEQVLTLDNVRNKVVVGNSLKLLKQLPDNCIHCVITSPPYWALRFYKTEGEIWGGDPNCDHDFSESYEISFRHRDGKGANHEVEKPRGTYNPEGTTVTSEFCVKCGSWKGELGLEPDFNLYLEHLIMIFQEVYRVLRKDGVCFVNISDTFFGGGFGVDEDIDKTKQGSNEGTIEGRDRLRNMRKNLKGYPDKCLCLIPERFVTMMRDKVGFIVRGKPIWMKPNGMTSSAEDRPTLDYEPVYMFTKTGKYYAETQYEPYAESTIAAYLQEDEEGQTSIVDYESDGARDYRGTGAQNPSQKKKNTLNSMKKKLKRTPKFGGNKAKGYGRETYSGENWNPKFGRQMRSVWNITTKPFGKEYCPTCDALRDNHSEILKRCDTCHQHIFEKPKVRTNTEGYDRSLIDGQDELEDKDLKEYCPVCKDETKKEYICVFCKTVIHSHFAMYPEELVARMIRWGCPEFICKKCHTPRKVVYEEERINTRPGNVTGFARSGGAEDPNESLHNSDLSRFRQEIVRTPVSLSDCGCNAGWYRGICLDPFGGMNTTGYVAAMLGRDFVTLEKQPLNARAGELRVAPLLQQRSLDNFA